MTLNLQLEFLYPYHAFPNWYGMYSRDFNVIFNVMHYSSLWFHSIYYGPYST